MEANGILDRVQARRCLEEVNHFLLRDAGEIIEVPGKISLIWNDPVYETRRFLSIKIAGEAHLLINGRRYPATEDGVQQGLRAAFKTQQPAD